MVKQLYIVGFLFFLVAFSGCKTKSSAVKSPDVIRIDKTKPDVIAQPKDPFKPADTIAEPIKDVIDKVIKYKDEYKVAVILPFKEDSVINSWANRVDTNLEDFNFSQQSEHSLSFIQGMMLAVKQIEPKAKLKLMVYDSKGSAFELNRALDKIYAEKVDFIVGGWDREDVKQISDFSKKHQIVYFSPFVPSSTIVENNSYYAMVEPSIEQHLKSIAEYIADSLSTAEIKILHENTLQGKNYSSMIADFLDKRVDEDVPELRYKKVEVAADANDRKNFNAGSHLENDKLNVLIIPSFNEGFIHAMLTQLNTYSTKNEIKIFGLPTWGDAEILRFRHFNNLNLHLSKSFWPNAEQSGMFFNSFTESYKKEPIETAYLGYDIACLITNMINEFGKDFDENINEYQAKGMSRYFNFQAVKNDKDKVVRYENTSLHIINYTNFEIQLKR
jgi:hypothetical protein